MRHELQADKVTHRPHQRSHPDANEARAWAEGIVLPYDSCPPQAIPELRGVGWTLTIIGGVEGDHGDGDDAQQQDQHREADLQRCPALRPRLGRAHICDVHLAL